MKKNQKKETSTPQHTEFEKEVSSLLEYHRTITEISIDWTTGGMQGGSCWGTEANQPVEGEVEPEFESLDKVLEHFSPSITFLQYKKLFRAVVETGTDTDSSYYGNFYNKAFKKVNLSVLEKYLKDNDLWQK